MGLFRWLERKFALGTVIRDYGVLGEHRKDDRRERIDLLLCERRGRVQLVFRVSVRAPGLTIRQYPAVTISPVVAAILTDLVSDTRWMLASDGLPRADRSGDMGPVAWAVDWDDSAADESQRSLARTLGTWLGRKLGFAGSGSGQLIRSYGRLGEYRGYSGLYRVMLRLCQQDGRVQLVLEYQIDGEHDPASRTCRATLTPEVGNVLADAVVDVRRLLQRDAPQACSGTS